MPWGDFLALHGAQVVMNDKKPSEQLESAIQALNDLDGHIASQIEWFFGSHPLSLLDGTDLCVYFGWGSIGSTLDSRS